MKLMFAVIHDEDANKAVKKLNQNKLGVTKLSSSGGFLKKRKYNVDDRSGG